MVVEEEEQISLGEAPSPLMRNWNLLLLYYKTVVDRVEGHPCTVSPSKIMAEILCILYVFECELTYMNLPG